MIYKSPSSRSAPQSRHHQWMVPIGGSPIWMDCNSPVIVRVLCSVLMMSHAG